MTYTPTIFNQIDTNKDGTLDYQELLQCFRNIGLVPPSDKIQHYY